MHLSSIFFFIMFVLFGIEIFIRKSIAISFPSLIVASHFLVKMELALELLRIEIAGVLVFEWIVV